MAEVESMAWRVAVEQRIAELESLVDSWRDVGSTLDSGGRGVPPFVWVVGAHVERLRATFEGLA